MLRLRLINPYLLIVSVLCCALSPAAMGVSQEMLKIDINTSLDITYVGWTGWYPGGNATVREYTFDNGIGSPSSIPPPVRCRLGSEATPTGVRLPVTLWNS